MSKKFKSMLSMILCAVIVFCSFSVCTLTAVAKNEEGKCGENATWVLNSNGVLEINGSGDITSHPWENYKDKITAVKISNQITGVCSGAFYECTSLTSITIPDSVIKLYASVFYGCSNLESAVIGKGVNYMEGGIFECTKIKDIYYVGTEENWNEIYIGPYNNYLNAATKHFYCSDSNHILKDGKCTNEGCWYTCSHTFSEWTIIKEASFFKDGEKIRNCTVNGCGKTETVPIPSTLNSFLNSIKNFFNNLFSFDF